MDLFLILLLILIASAWLLILLPLARRSAWYYRLTQRAPRLSRLDEIRAIAIREDMEQFLSREDRHATFTHQEEEVALKDAWARVDECERRWARRPSIFDGEVLPTIVLGICILISIGVVLSAILGL